MDGDADCTLDWFWGCTRNPRNGERLCLNYNKQLCANETVRVTCELISDLFTDVHYLVSERVPSCNV